VLGHFVSAVIGTKDDKVLSGLPISELSTLLVTGERERTDWAGGSLHLQTSINGILRPDR
jgi:hypothetical protein